MFLQQGNESHAENVCWMVSPPKECDGPRFKSPFTEKVRCDFWAERKGCCKTIGPPPRMAFNCPDHFLKKHSRQVPVFFRRGELVLKRSEFDKKEEADELPAPKASRFPPLDTGLPSWRSKNKSRNECDFPRPPSRMGLFRSPFEESYEKRYKTNKPSSCKCDDLFWEELLRATECAGVMAAEMEKKNKGGRYSHLYPKSTSLGKSSQPSKDYIRANAVRAIRMPPRRLRRCYVDSCGIHLVDLTDSPFVLRPGFGKVPGYICRRKMELLQEDLDSKARMEAETQGDCRVVPNTERELVIQGLKDYWSDLLAQYNSLPLNDDGKERYRELKTGLEERMKEVEQDLRLLTSTSMLLVGDVDGQHYI